VVGGDTVEAARDAKLSHGWLPNNEQCWMGGAIGGKDARERSHRAVGGRKMHDHTLTLSHDGLDNRVTLLYGRSHSIISIDMTKHSVFVFYTILLLNMCPAIVILC
jgi:hypothetical protein